MIASNSTISNNPQGTFSQDTMMPHSTEQVSSTVVSSTSPDNKVDSVTENYFSDLRFRTALDSGKFYCDDSPIHSIPKELKMDFSRLLEKPFFVGNFDWTTSGIGGSLLTSLDIPRGLLTNVLARIPFNSSAYWRGCIKLIFQLSGTAQHSGTLLIFSAPPSTSITVKTLNAAMLCPHIFLSANQASTGNLEVPFFFPGRLALCDVTGVSSNVMRFDGANNNNTAFVGVYILNPLSAPTSGSTTLRFSVYAHFSDLEFYVPKTTPVFNPPVFEAESKVISNLLDTVTGGLKRASGDFIDQGRKLLTYYTGLHNPNIPTITERMLITKYNLANTVDAPQFFEKMDAFMDYDRTVNSKLYNSMIDEMDILHLIRKPQLISVLNFSTSTNAGALLAAYPICPFMVPLPSATNARSVPLIQKLYLFSRYWRGSLNLIFQSSQSNFQFFRLQLSRYYAPSLTALTQDPAFESMSNMPVTAMEFSAGGQVQVVNLPFCSPINQLFSTTDPNLMSTQHGMAYLHLITPVVTGASSQTNVSVNVYLQAGPDFQFFGFATNDTIREQVLLLRDEEQQSEEMDFEAESDSIAPFNLSLPEVLMNKPEVASKPAEDSDMRPLVSLRDLMRRMYYCGTLSYVNGSEPLWTEIEDLLVGNSNFGSSNPLSVLLRTFWGFTGDLKIRIQAIGASDFQVKYNPPCAYLNQQATYAMAPGRGRILDNYLGPRTVADNVNFSPFTQNCIENILPSLNVKIQDQVMPTTNYNLVSKVAEVVVPCYTPFKFNTTLNRNSSVRDVASASFGNLSFVFPKTSTAGVDNNILLLFWIGAGDSFRCGFNTLDTKLVMNSLGGNILSGDGPSPLELGQVIPKISDFNGRNWFRITDVLP